MDHANTSNTKPWCILAATMGSHAYGISLAGSDADVRGVFCAPPDVRHDIFNPPELLKNERWLIEAAKAKNAKVAMADSLNYELVKFIRMLCTGATIPLELLWLDDKDYLVCDQVGELLRSYRARFGTFKSKTKFIGVAKSYYDHTTKNAVGNAYSYKHAAHAVRCLRMAVEFLTTGKLLVNRVGLDADELLHVRSGGWSFDKFNEEFEALLRKVDALQLADTPLSAEVNKHSVNSVYQSVLLNSYLRFE